MSDDVTGGYRIYVEDESGNRYSAHAADGKCSEDTCDLYRKCICEEKDGNDVVAKPCSSMWNALHWLMRPCGDVWFRKVGASVGRWDSHEYEDVMAREFVAMTNTVTAISGMHGVTVTVVYVKDKIMDWMEEQERLGGHCEPCYKAARVNYGVMWTGSRRVTIRPEGVDHDIIVKPKERMEGKTLWRIECGSV